MVIMMTMVPMMSVVTMVHVPAVPQLLELAIRHRSLPALSNQLVHVMLSVFLCEECVLAWNIDVLIIIFFFCILLHIEQTT